MSNFVRNYYPKRPVKSFQDLEVYQKLLAVSVAVAKRVKNQKAIDTAMDLPVKVATAHSLRFADQIKALQTLEEAMLSCNLLIVYLEQYRDIENFDIETEFFEEQIRVLLTTRFKLMHLQQSWKKFSLERKEQK